MLAAGLGLVYAVVAVLSGRFAQRFGCLPVLRLGIIVLCLVFAAQLWVSNLWVVIGCLVLGNIGMCFVWPALEALVSEGEPPARLQRLIGIYNIVWSFTGAFAYFTGGALIKHWGWNGLFCVTAGIELLELAIVLWIHANAWKQPPAPKTATQTDTAARPTVRSPIAPKTFLKMALLANPFAYLAINTVVSVIPTVAAKLSLDTMQTGFVCSVWLFTRAGSFVWLWLWSGWHYRFRHLAAGFVALAASFAVILLTHSLSALVMAQAVMGVALGLIYYSSLFYSMDVGEAKGEHGGIHEGAIGAGCCAGPAMAACGLYFFPANPASGAYAVTLLLACGLGGLYWLRYGAKNR
jgi:MFS family permease